jgi:hypothetical protein
MARLHAKDSASQQRRRFGPGRSAIRHASNARGRRLFNLWYHYSPRLKRDVILRSDLAFAHFCWVEADPNVLRYELEPEPLPVAAGSTLDRIEFDALVELRSSPPELRKLGNKDSADEEFPREQVAARRDAKKAGFQFFHVTPKTLSAHAQLIRNWRCALAFQAACREVLLSPYESEVLDLARAKQKCSLDELLIGTNPVLRPKYHAALFALLQQAKLHSDLSANPLCAASLIWMPEVGHG